MTATELYHSIVKFDSSELSFPFHYEDPDDYYDYVCRTIEIYLAKLKSCEPESITQLNNCLSVFGVPLHKDLNLLSDVEELCDVLKLCIAFLFKGNIPSAYDALENFFIADDCHYLLLLPMVQVSRGFSFYRIRNKKNLSNQGEIFHIPFNLRTLVRTERYSIPGYPVLYLSSSFACAWEETGKAKLSSLSFSKFHLEKGNYSIIDFVPPVSCEGWQLYTWLMFYPLIMACSVDVLKKGDPYKPEYAIPQLFLQILRDHAIDNGIIGLKYLSVQAPEYNLNDGSYHSYVFPTSYSDNKEGYCPKLSEIFKFSKPVQLPRSIICKARLTKSKECFMKSGLNVKPIIEFANELELSRFNGE